MPEDSTPRLPAGCVAGLFRADAGGHLPVAEHSLHLVPGRGVEGDRYYLGSGTWQKYGYGDQLSLIAAETLDALAHEHGVRLGPAEARRNVLTRGVDLAQLIGARFTLGDVTCVGLRSIPPCGHLERLTLAGVRDALRGRGGLYANILTEGTISVGEALRALEPPRRWPW